MVAQVEQVRPTQERTQIPSPSELYIPLSKEQEYAQEHNIEFHRLQNGIRLIGVNRKVEDRATASVYFTFPTGAYFDPSDKSGAHHFLEHLMAYDLVKLGAKHHAKTNATTRMTELEFYVKGPAHPDVSEYGVWPILPHLINTALHPLEQNESIDALFQSEKESILKEITMYHNDPAFLAAKAVRELVLDKANPNYGFSTGTLESVKNISLADLRSLASQIIVPDRLVVSVFTEGDERIKRKIIDTLIDQLSNFPRVDKAQNLLDRTLLEQFNSEFALGKEYTFDIPGLNENLISSYLWKLPCERFIPERSALVRLQELLQDKFWTYIRSRGLSYAPTVSLGFTEGTANIVLALQTDNTQEMTDAIRKTLMDDIKIHVLSSITEEEYENLNRNYHLAKKAVPREIGERFTDAVTGVSEKDMIFDTDKFDLVDDAVEVSHFKTWVDKLSAIKPALLLFKDEVFMKTGRSRVHPAEEQVQGDIELISPIPLPVPGLEERDERLAA
ncbi:MAG: insulinase family protein [Candidatus Levybacteria bacterium]|nr:insulinase family protein [Candidatus Levybacteria bacterium]